MRPFSFVHVPKTGGMSIRSAIAGGGNHIRASEVTGFRVAFVRHPFTRLHSAFEFLRDPAWTQCQVPADLTFEQFVLSRGWERWPNPLFEPMTYWIDAPCGFIGRFESLASDFQRLCAILDIQRPVALPHLHRRLSDRQPAWTAETQAVVLDAYRSDFEGFGYGS